MGLPDQAAVAFLFGFFRRDYGAAGLYDLHSVMSGTQRHRLDRDHDAVRPVHRPVLGHHERAGWRTAVAMTLFIFPFAFALGGLLYGVIRLLGLSL